MRIVDPKEKSEGVPDPMDPASLLGGVEDTRYGGLEAGSRGKISRASQTAHETDARWAKRTFRPGGVVVQSLNSVQLPPRS